jgi:hypothetical protein
MLARQQGGGRGGEGFERRRRSDAARGVVRELGREEIRRRPAPRRCPDGGGTRARKARLVATPRQTVRSSASASCSTAVARVGAWAISLPSMES